MSAEALEWAWRQDAPANEKFLLVAIADGASMKGVSIEGAKELATKTGGGESTVRKNLGRLVERGLLLKQARYDTTAGGRLTDVLVLPLSPAPRLGTFREHRADPPLDPSSIPLSDRAEPPSRSEQEPPSRSEHLPRESSRTTSSLFLEPALVDAEIATDAETFLKAKRKVDGKIVTKDEMAKAAVMLTAFNRTGGTDFGLGSQLAKIVMRIRERPSWDEAKHVRLVESAWRLKWWERNGRGGRPTPSVIWGNSQCFERVALDASDEAAGRTEKIEERKTSYMKDVIE